MPKLLEKSFVFAHMWLVLLLTLGICGGWTSLALEPSPLAKPNAHTRLKVNSRSATSSLSLNTVEELRTAIQSVLRKPILTPATYGVKIASLDTGKVLYEENSAKLLRPASNLKLYTWAAALDKLSPDYRFRTSVYSPASPDGAGTIHGSLTVYGRGDPTFAARFNNGDYNKAIDVLASKIAAAGVKTVEGDLVGDETYFTGPRFAPGWVWEDLQWWYGAEISALTVNDNSVDLSIKPGTNVGDPCNVSVGPSTTLVRINNHTRSAVTGTGSAVTIYREIGSNTLEVGGSMAIDSRGYSGSVAVSHPSEMFITLLRTSLARIGVNVTGRSRVAERIEPTGDYPQTEPRTEIVSVQSPPLGVIAAQTLKTSQNLYSELVLRALGKASGPAPGITDDVAGINAVRNLLKAAGADSADLTITDGSGLSLNDLVTADSTLQLLVFMTRHRYAVTFRNALPVAGVDGTLKNRMKKTPAAGNVRAKTGTLASAASLSGYVTSARDERLVFSIMVNNFASGSEEEVRRNVIDAIAILLASFSGHS